MARRIDRDKHRYLDIVRGRTRKELKKLIKEGGVLGKRDGKTIRIPIPITDLPRIRYGGGNGGVGSGDGEEGDIIGREDDGEEGNKPGDQDGEFMFEEWSVDELAEFLYEELELPNIEPKGKKNIYAPSDKLKTISRVGSPGRIHKKRTLKNAMKRSLASGNYRPGQLIVPAPPDRRFRSFKDELIPEMNAVIFYMMDVSGSMGDEQKEIVRTQNFWIDVLLANKYQGLESRYITHHASAREVSREDFYHSRESGGTMISSAFRKCADIFHEDYNPDDWNAYIFYSSDGDNWSADDTNLTFKIMDEELLPHFNLLGYTQVKSPYGSGQFMEDMEKRYGDEILDPDSNIVTATLDDVDDIIDGIKELFSKGK